MDYQELDQVIQKANARQKAIIFGKGKEYSLDDDALANFKRNAELTGTTPIVVLRIFLQKHLDSINSKLTSGDLHSFESIEGRIDDAINYLHLLEALLIDLDGDTVRALKNDGSNPPRIPNQSTDSGRVDL